MHKNIIMPTFVLVWALERSAELPSALAASVPPTTHRIRAIMEGSWATWMMRLRRELAVARLVIILLPMRKRPDVAASVSMATLESDLMCVETSSVLVS